MNWQERAEKAEAELARLLDQKPVLYVSFSDSETMRFWATEKPKNSRYPIKEFYAAPVPAVSDKRVDELAMLIRRLVRRLNQELPHNDIGEAAMDYLARNGISGEILRGWAAPAVPEEWRKVMAELADDLAIEIDQNYPPERRAYPSEQRKYEGEMVIVNRARALLQSAPAAPALSVPEEWKAQILAEFPLLDDEGLCQEKHHCEWTLQQDRKRLHTLLQSTGEHDGH